MFLQNMLHSIFPVILTLYLRNPEVNRVPSEARATPIKISPQQQIIYPYYLGSSLVFEVSL